MEEICGDSDCKCPEPVQKKKLGLGYRVRETQADGSVS